MKKILLVILFITLILISYTCKANSGSEYCPVIEFDDSSKGLIYSYGTIRISAIVYDRQSGINQSSIVFTVDNQSYTFSYYNQWEFSSTINVTEGNHEICIYAEDMSGNPTKNCTIITNIILSEVTSSERTIDSSKFTFNASWSYKNGSYPVDYFSLVFGNGYKCNTTNNWYNGPIIWDGGLSNYMTLSIRPIDSEGHIGKSSGIAIYSPSAYINYYQFGNGQVKFEAISSYDFDGEIIQYFWDFGDGETSIEKETLHNYSNPGYYNVSLTVTDNDGFKSTENITISVLIPPEPPVAKISGPYTINKGEFVILNASGSYDPDLDGRIISYKWDFGDGETGYGQIVNHTYNTTGTYDVTVTVMDEYGLTDTETTSVTVIDSPKEASKDNGGSPGFELIFIIIALGVILYFKRRKIS